MSAIDGDQSGQATEVLDPRDDGDDGDEMERALLATPALEDPIRQAERELREAQDKLADAKDKAKRDEEVDKALGQYEAAQVDLEADDTALIDHLSEALIKLAPTVREKERVRREVDRLTAPIAKLEGAVDADGKAIVETKAVLATRTKERDAAKKAFEDLKNQIKRIETRHAQANAVRKEIADARAKEQRLLAYYLLEYRLKPLTTSEPAPIEFDEYRKKIRETAAGYGGLIRAVLDLEASLKESEAKLAADQKTLADAQKAYDAALRARLTA